MSCYVVVHVANEPAVMSVVVASEKSTIASGFICGLHTVLTVSIALSVFLNNTG